MFESDVRIAKVPESVRGQAEALGLCDPECLFSVRSDLALDGKAREVWLVVTRRRMVTLAADEEAPLSGPFALEAVQRVRLHQTVGSGFLQFMVEGLFVDAVRFSNAKREVFSRAQGQIERLLHGEPFVAEALTRPSDVICAQCGLPLTRRGEACPRCRGRRGIFLRTLGLMRPYWPYIALMLVLLGISVGLSLVPPYLVRSLVDQVLTPREHLGWLKWFLLGLVGVAALRCVLGICTGLVNTAVGTRIGQELREVLHRKLISLDVDYFDRYSTGQLLTRVLSDVDYFTGFVSQAAEGFLLNVLTVVGISVMLFVMNWRLALLVLLPVPFVIAGTYVFWKQIYTRYHPVYDTRSKMAQILSSVLSGIRLVKVFGQQEREMRRFETSAAAMRDAVRAVGYRRAVFNPVMAFVFGLGGVIIWFSGGRMVFNEEVSLGTLMAVLSYVSMFYAPIRSLTMFSNWTTGFVSAGQRVFEILDASATLSQPARPVRLRQVGGAIEFRNVTFGYDPYNPVLKNVSFRIEPGHFIGIVGKSGSGKTTLVNLLCRFYDPQEGQVLIDGVDVRELAQEDLRRQVALVLQEPLLFRGSVRDNIVYGRPGADAVEVIEAARAANAHDFITAMPAAYDTKLGERGAGLSGGERQRITIARGLIRDPKILILDEATSSVDTESEQLIQRSLLEVARGRTTIVIAHRLSTLRNSDRIFVIDAGRIVESGTHEELVRQGGLYWKLVRIQSELARLEQE